MTCNTINNATKKIIASNGKITLITPMITFT